MGCTPSHSDIVKNHEKHRTKLLNRGIQLVSQGGDGFSFPLLIKDSSSYDTKNVKQGGTQIDFLKNVSNEEKNVNFHSSSEDPSLPELDQKEQETKKILLEAEIAISELIESDKCIGEAIKSKRQKCCKSENVDFTVEDNSEGKENQNPQKGKKQKSRQGKETQPCKAKDKSSPSIIKPEKKVDFPEVLVKAHQTAYAYLNPNLSKYEVIIGLTNQATETQLSVQRMVNFLGFCFDEINHHLEEIAEDGEKLLRELGGNLTWPADGGNPKEQPDLLQQLLQYTVNKMQQLNGTVASLTSDALQESCSFLQSASSSLEKKLKAKQSFDERLIRMIKLLEDSAVGSPHPSLDDIYSEDSGLGIDSESVKELKLSDKQEMETNCGSYSHPPNQCRISRESKWPCNSVYGITKSQDYAFERQFKYIFSPSPQIGNAMQSSEEASESGCTFHQHQIFRNEYHDITHESICFKDCKSSSISSINEDSDSNCSSEEEYDIRCLSENEKYALSKRSTSFSAAKGGKQTPSTKRIDSPDNEELIIKMKDAISEKIKYVPRKSGHREWMEDENGKGYLRPSTASGSQKTSVKEIRSRSEESLKSHAEDPTLLELQRTQKDLDKRMERFYTLNRIKETNDTLVSWNAQRPSDLQHFEHITYNPSTNKLNASLAKNFSTPPNQDKASSYRPNENTVKCRKPVTTGISSKDLICRKENDPRTQKLNSDYCIPPHTSVQKLIETFSSPESLVKSASLKMLGPIKCIRKLGLQSISPSLPGGPFPLNHKHKTLPSEDINCENTNASNHCTFCSNNSLVFLTSHDINDSGEVDIENLPPPPPEMLIDILPESTEFSEDVKIEEKYSEVAHKMAKTNEHSTTKKITPISQRMKRSLWSFDVLPSKNLNNPKFANKASNNVEANTIPKTYSLYLNSAQMYDCHQRDHEMEKTADLYKLSCKIIPLPNPTETSEQNGSDQENKNSSESSIAQNHISPNLLKKKEKIPGFVHRGTPVRALPSSPPNQKRLPSSPLYHKCVHQVSSPTLHQQPSPPTLPRATNLPGQRKVISPPTQQNLPSPPMIQKQQNPSVCQKVSSPPPHCHEAKPPSFAATPFPSAAPSQLHKCLQNNMDSKDEQYSASPKIVSNVHSIFCPAESSLFEAKPVLSPTSNTVGTALVQPEASTCAQRKSLQLRRFVDDQRMDTSAASPQPFIRRSFSDRRPGFQLLLPSFTTADSGPALSKTRMENDLSKEGDSWNSRRFSEGKRVGKSSSYPELFVMGQGLQKI